MQKILLRYSIFRNVLYHFYWKCSIDKWFDDDPVIWITCEFKRFVRDRLKF